MYTSTNYHKICTYLTNSKMIKYNAPRAPKNFSSMVIVKLQANES